MRLPDLHLWKETSEEPNNGEPWADSTLKPVIIIGSVSRDMINLQTWLIQGTLLHTLKIWFQNHNRDREEK